ncbi:hypothetical protein OG948_19825 [Embleya sp. NBC_00888]|uniref:hypothetical protein n=1 Tax=Embleya sp. NBC_00888 TaxID=2975960 RepID=UPI00386517D3|nr:hypothetical protein OG948_19825 [Embleya sp. NBC_00888]
MATIGAIVSAVIGGFLLLLAGVTSLMPVVRNLLVEIALTKDQWREIRHRRDHEGTFSPKQAIDQRVKLNEPRSGMSQGSTSDGDIPTSRVHGSVTDAPHSDDPPSLQVAAPPDVDSATGR